MLCVPYWEGFRKIRADVLGLAARGHDGRVLFRDIAGHGVL